MSTTHRPSRRRRGRTSITAHVLAAYAAWDALDDLLIDGRVREPGAADRLYDASADLLDSLDRIKAILEAAGLTTQRSD